MTHGRKIRGRVLSNPSWIRITSQKDLHDLSETIVELIIDTSQLRDGVRHYGSVSIESLAYGVSPFPFRSTFRRTQTQLRVEPKFVQFDLVKAGDPQSSTRFAFGMRRVCPCPFAARQANWLKTMSSTSWVCDLRVCLTAMSRTCARADLQRTDRGTCFEWAGDNCRESHGIPQAKSLPDLMNESEWGVSVPLEASTEWEQNFLQVVTLQVGRRMEAHAHTTRDARRCGQVMEKATKDGYWSSQTNRY